MMTLQHLIRKFSRAASTIVAGLGMQAIAQVGGPADELFTLDHPRAQAVMAVQKTVTPDLMKLPGVLGTAVGLDPSGAAALVVYVDSDSPGRAEIVRGLPPQVRGVSVTVELTDKFRAFAAHTAKQSPPIQLGTSGGWSYDLANGFCCGGTLGSLVQINGVQYILSNYHVFEADIVSGGNGIVANTGDPILQPGLIDVGCNSAGAQAVGSLIRLGSLPNSNVDVSVAQVSSGLVRSDGAILEIGTISKNTVSAALRLGVKKSGRTSGLTSSSISGLNATISVTYDNECAGGTAFSKVFTGQIVVSNRGGKFLKAGDSGSLLVENVTANPRAVGLLYAGSSTSAIANPINEVLQFIGGKLGATATMVGN
jgi:hypothetical protein